MANLGEFKTRIIAETNRDDLGTGQALETQLNLCIARAIEYYQDEAFWFKHQVGTKTTVAGTATIALPTAIRFAEIVTYLGEPLRKLPLGEIEGRTERGLASNWADNGSLIQLWPIPDAAYVLGIYGPAYTAAPNLDADEGIWVNEAQDLIAARVRFLLSRDVFRDTDGVQYAAQAEGEALSRLRRETRRRGVTALRTDIPVRSSFDILAG